MEKSFFKGNRLTTAYYRSGVENEKKLLLIHGNVSSSEFYLPLFDRLADTYDVIALDLRCFGDSEAKPVDATKGYRCWTEDIKEFISFIGWAHFYILGWSLGGNIAMQYAVDYSEKLDGMILINPGSPFGFGGTRDAEGTLLEPAGLASGGGCANRQLVESLEKGETEILINTLHNVYFKPDFVLDAETEKMFIESMLKTRTGEGMYPGNSVIAPVWPFVASGDSGICNTMSPVYGNVSSLADIKHKPDILWIRGKDDIMVSDNSICDFGFLGMSGIVPGWPGMDVFPPQPMVSQTRYILDRYRENGGSYSEILLSGGHGCHLESSDEFLTELNKFTN